MPHGDVCDVEHVRKEIVTKMRYAPRNIASRVAACATAHVATRVAAHVAARVAVRVAACVAVHVAARVSAYRLSKPADRRRGHTHRYASVRAHTQTQTHSETHNGPRPV